jgi:glycosyltransferase involved in cell wall biosynthesis
MKIALITAGGAGMFCGSCMQDNTLVRALRLAGADAMLIPTYTPITVDEDNASTDRVFMGGINVYLDSKIPGWRSLPRFLKRPLDRPIVVRLLSRLSTSTDASKLGPLTIDMLTGAAGPQQQEITELCDALVRDMRPDVVIFGNALLSGVIPLLRRQFSGALHVLLQGDDVFLDGLPKKHRAQSIDLIRKNCESVDLFLTHSDYYTQHMTSLLHLPADRVRQIPLSIDVDESLTGTDEPQTNTRFTVGFFARVCPEKGVHRLLEAVPQLMASVPDTHVVIAGFLPQQHHKWFMRHLENARRVVGTERIEWLGSPRHRDQKFDILRSLDVMCIPTEYHEPKGLSVLEAALVGVPSVLPRHGAFPERIELLGSGILFDPSDITQLSDALSHAAAVRDDLRAERPMLQDNLRVHHDMQSTGGKVLQVLQRAE